MSYRLQFFTARCEEVGSEINLVSSVSLHQASMWHNRTGLLEVAPVLLFSALDCKEFVSGDVGFTNFLSSNGHL